MIPIYIAQYYNGYPNMMDGGDWGWGLLMMTFWVVIIVGIVFFIVHSSHHSHNESSKSNDSLEIAKRRYANGEVTKEEFEQLKKDLK